MTRRRDDRPAADPFKQRIPPDDHPHPDYDADRRRNRSATFPAHSYDPRSYPPHDARYEQPPRRHDPPRYPSPSHRPPPSTSKTYQYATRPSAHHHPQPTPAYPVATSSRRPHPEVPDPRPPRRPAPQSYDHPSSGEEAVARTSRPPPRVVHSSTQPPPANQAFWIPPQEISSSRRHRDHYQERDREREKPTTELENRFKDRTRTDRHRERERERERAPEVRYQESSRNRHHDRRKDSDTEGVLYPEQRNTSKASLSGREGYSASVREPSNGHRRHRTEDGTTSIGRRHQPENMQNPITMPSQSTNVPQSDVQQTGEPPPAPRVMPVYLPPKVKSQRSHREARPSTTQTALSGSDTERAHGKLRMERTPSGPAVQRSDGYIPSSARERGNHDVMMGPRDDPKRPEIKYGVHQDTRQPLAPINVDIPLVTPGFNASALPTETRASAVPQIVSIRAGQGPSDPHDAHFKSSAISHSDAPQEIVIHPPHPTSASIVKPSITRAQSDRPAVEHQRTEPRGDVPPPGQRVSIHESSRALPTPIPKPPYSRGNPETGVDNPTSSYPQSRPPSRSAHRTSTSNAVPPAVVGPRPLRSVSQGGLQTNEPPTRPPSVAQYVPTLSSTPNQYSVPPSPAHPTNGSPPKAGHTHGSLSSAQPSPRNIQLLGVSPSHSTSTQQAPSAPPSVHPTPTIVPRTLTTSSRPSTRDGPHTDAPYVHQQAVGRQPVADNRPGPRQASDSTTVKASWVVQTPATVKGVKISREDKYLRDHHVNSETPHAQLRQVLSQDDYSFPRASSSMMKASLATTPTASSQRNSPGAKGRDVPFGTPRTTSANTSLSFGSAREAPTPAHVPRHNLPPHLAGPPQIAVVGATPATIACDLPQDRVDHALLAPPFPAPTRASRTASTSQDQPPQPAARTTPSTPYQPQLPPAVHAPSLFQPYRPPSLPAPEDNGQFSPPPLPIPPPKGLEDSPPPPIETRTSEIIPTRSQSDGYPQSYVHSVPEAQSEMFHMPSQSSTPPQLSSVPPPRTTHAWQLNKLDMNTVPTPTSNGSIAEVHADARSSKPTFVQPDNVQVVHQEIMRCIPVLPSQSSALPTKPRPKVTVEDVPEDSPVSSKAVHTSMPMTTPPVPASRPAHPSQPPTVANANATSKSVVVDQPGHRLSPQSRSKDPPLHRGTEPSTMTPAPAMPPPTSASTTTPTRMPTSAPPTQPTTLPSAQVAPAQRTTSHSTPSRSSQRAAEMLQATKLSTYAGSNSVTTGSVNKSAAAPVQTTHNPVGTATGHHQPVNGAVGVQGPTASKLVNGPTTFAPHSTTASMPKAAHTTTIGPGPPVGALGLHISAPSTNINTQTPSTPDPLRQQPGYPGASSMPSLDVTPTTVMPTATVKNTHQDQPVIDVTRPRDVMPSSTRNLPPSSHIYPISARPSTSTAVTQQTHTTTPAQPSTHYRVASLPVTSSSLAVQKPPSPRKSSQPIVSTTVSTQPFPSRPSVPESHSTRIPVSGHLPTPAPARQTRLPPLDRINDPDMLKTPSSIAPSPMLNPDTSNAAPQSVTVPIRARQSSTDSKDDKKKPSGLFGLFRTRTLSSKAAEPPVAPTVTRASLDQTRAHPDATFVPRGVTSTSAVKGSNSTPPLATSTSARGGLHPKVKGRVPDPIAVPAHPAQAGRGQRDATPHIFTSFKFLTTHTKRNRTVSAASLDVCDGNTATNTVVGSPNHSAISQAHPLPPIIPPDVRDPLVATSEWRDREEAERRERRTHRIRRPGVTFDVEEEPPSPAPGTTNKRKKLVRRLSGRAATPGPPRG